MPHRHRTESLTSPRRILAARHGDEALQLRMQGYQFQEIASMTHYWRGATGAYEAVKAALARVPQHSAQEYRSLNLERLDHARKANWQAVEAGKHQGIASELAIQERESRYLGLDAPVRQQIATDVHILIEIVPSPALPALGGPAAGKVVEGVVGSVAKGALGAPRPTPSREEA